MKKQLLLGLIVIYANLLIADEQVKIGSKSFTENYILAEIVAQIIEKDFDMTVSRKYGMGGTGVIFSALQKEEIDIYIEYSGTIIENVLENKEIKTIDEIQYALDKKNVIASRGLGFNNTYIVAIKRKLSEERNIRLISDLKYHNDLRAGFSHEFIDRDDGYYSMAEVYGLKLSSIKSMLHHLSYEAIAANQIDIMDAYSTDPKLQKYDLVQLQDNYYFFPFYYPMILANKKFVEKYPLIWKKLKTLENSLNNQKMTSLNAMVEDEGMDFSEVAQNFLGGKNSSDQLKTRMKSFLLLTFDHLSLVMVSMLFSLMVAIPLGILSAKYDFLSQIVFIIVSVLQTIPAFALLCFLVPILGIGKYPAIASLFIYALLPIVKTTESGLRAIPRELKEISYVLGLSWLHRLIYVEFPMAFKGILSGIKISLVLTVGNATLAGFVGAGGYGVPIIVGFSLNNYQMMLKGAFPAALMALSFHILFEILEYLYTPRYFAYSLKS